MFTVSDGLRNGPAGMQCQAPVAPRRTIALGVCRGGRSPALLGSGMEQPFPAPRALAPIPPQQTQSHR